MVPGNNLSDNMLIVVFWKTCFLHRHRFPSQGGFVHDDTSVKQEAIAWDGSTIFNFDHVTGRELIGRDFLTCSAELMMIFGT